MTVPAAASPHPAPALSARGLTLTFGRGDAAVTALNNVDVQLPRGSWTSIVGRSGSGKTTLLHVLSGLKTPDSGTVTLHPNPATGAGEVTVTSLNDEQRTRLRRDRIGIIFQDFNLVPVLTVRDNILLPRKLARTGVDKQLFDSIVTELGLGDRLGHTPSQLSGGQQQRVAIARALLGQPDIIFADEPTGNLDSQSAATVLAMFRRIVDTFGTTLALVTHDQDAARAGDWMIHVADGQITREK